MLACAPARVEGGDFDPRRGERRHRADRGGDETGFEEPEYIVYAEGYQERDDERERGGVVFVELVRCRVNIKVA